MDIKLKDIKNLTLANKLSLIVEYAKKDSAEFDKVNTKIMDHVRSTLGGDPKCLQGILKSLKDEKIEDELEKLAVKYLNIVLALVLNIYGVNMALDKNASILESAMFVVEDLELQNREQLSKRIDELSEEL